MDVVLEVSLLQKDAVTELKSLFPDSDYEERYSITGGDIAQIITSLTGLLAVISSSAVLTEYIRSKIITVRVGGIEYIGRAEDMPSYLEEKIKEAENEKH